jgi:hypothetical protein
MLSLTDKQYRILVRFILIHLDDAFAQVFWVTEGTMRYATKTYKNAHFIHGIVSRPNPGS